MERLVPTIPLGLLALWRLTHPDENGVLQLTHGALLPERYQLSAEIPGHPWICPLRTCRRAFPALVRLGGHFNVSYITKSAAQTTNSHDSACA